MKKVILLAIFSIVSVFSADLFAQTGTPIERKQEEQTNKGPQGTPIEQAKQPSAPAPVVEAKKSDPMVFGVKAALGVSNIMDNANQDMRFAYGIGVVVDARLTESLSFQPEVLYVTKGATNNINTPLNKMVTVKTATSYLELPLMLKLNIGKNGLLVGPYLGFKISQDLVASYEDKDNDAWLLQTAKYNPDINFVDFGFSAGYERQIDDRMILDVRLNYGLRTITDKSSIKVEKASQAAEVFPFNNPKNVSFMIGFRYTIR